MTERSGTVFVAEDSDDEDLGMWSGRFSAHWEAHDGSQPWFVEGPQGVPLDEAIAWGRSQADVVLVLLGPYDVRYSAGTRHPVVDGEQLPVWPESATVERRRRAGMEHLDIAADEPVRWTVRLARQLPAEGFEQHVRRVADALAADDSVAELRVDDGRQPFEAGFRFSVLARSHAEAFDRVLAVEERTSDAAPSAIDGVTLRDDRTSYVPMGWDPVADIRPADR